MNRGIQILKGIAALMVFLSHALNMREIAWVLKYQLTPFHFLWDGQCAVIIFMGISGFFYYKTEFTGGGYFNGIKKIVLRIYPLAIIVLSFAFVLCNLQILYNQGVFSDWGNSFWNKPIGMIDYLKNVSLLLLCDSDLLDPPIWYLFVEVRMFLIMPLLIGLWIKKGIWLSSLIILLVCVSPILPTYIEYLPINFIGSFFRWLNERYVYRWRTEYFWLFCIFGVVLLDINNIVECENNITYRIVQAFGAAFIVVGLYNIVFKQNMLCKLLEKMGNVSYEFFLLHFVVLLSFRILCLPTWLYILLSLATSILLSYLLNISLSRIIRIKK